MNTILFKILLFTLSIQLIAGNTATLERKHTPGDPRLVLGNIKKFYTSHDYLYQELAYRLFADHTSTIPYSIEKGVFIKHGEAQYSQLSSIESLTTQEYTIGIDHDEKIVMISNHLSLPATGPLATADTWTSSESTFIIKPVSDQLNALSAKMAHGEVEEADIIYDITTFQPIKLVLKYRRDIQLESDPESPVVQPRVEIEYTTTQFDGQGKEYLQMNAYLIKKEGQWFLPSKFKGYELINNIHEFPEEN